MKIRTKHSDWMTLGGIAGIYLMLWFWMPVPSFWGLDNGIKFQGARSYIETGSIQLPYSGVDFDPEGIYRPMIAPFGNMSEGNQIPTFSVLFMLVAGLFYGLFGQVGPHLFSLLGGLACLYAGLLLWQHVRPKVDATIYLIILGLGSPLLYYSLTLWEHSWATALVMFSYLALFQTNTRTLQDQKGYVNLVVAGLLVGLAVALRTEAVMWIVLTLTFWQRTGRRWRAMIPYTSGVGLGFIIMFTVNYLQTDSMIPLHLLSNLEAHKQTSLVDLVLSRINNLYVALLAGFPNRFLSMFGLIPIAVIGFWHKLRHFNSLWFWLTAMVLIMWGFYWVEVLNAGNRSAYMGASGGLFWIVPLSALAIMKLRRERRHLATFIWYAIGVFIMLYVIASPRSSGIHWGPRFIVTCIPFVLLLATLRLRHWWRGIRQTRYLIILLLLFSIWGQAYSVQTLYTVRSENQKMNAWIEETGSEIIVTSMWWLAGDCGLSSEHVPWYTVNSVSQIRSLVDQFRSEGETKINFVEYYPFIPEQHWRSMGVEYVDADYFPGRDRQFRRSHLRIIK